MTLEEKIAKFMVGTIVLHTPTEKIYSLLMQKLENMGVEWGSGAKPTMRTRWPNNRESTCVSFRGITDVEQNRFHTIH